jgi:hypothetical protein
MSAGMETDAAAHAGILRPGRRPQRLTIAVGALAVALAGIGIWGWAKYGAAVFYEMIASGIASCL